MSWIDSNNRINPSLRRWIIFIGLWVCFFLAWGCSSKNSEAPPANQVHVAKYILIHANEALGEIERCQVCHGRDLKGGTQVTGCFSCHADTLPIALHPVPYSDPEDHGAPGRSEGARCFGCHGTPPNLFNGGVLSDPDFFNIATADCSAPACHPDAGAHPTRWQGDNDDTPAYLSSHRNISLTTIQQGCAMCHRISDNGSSPLPGAPSCFAAGFTNADDVTSGCHPAGFEPYHDLPYADPDDHGPPAKADLSECQQCHGTPGTIFFDGGSASTSCSSAACHPDAGAHPTTWSSGHRSAGAINSSCTICHDVTEGRIAPNDDAPSCYSGSFTNADGIASSCHDDGPDD